MSNKKTMILKAISFIFILVVAVLFVDIKIGNLNQEIPYSFEKGNENGEIIIASQYYDNEDLTKGYTTYVTVYNDGKVSVDFWPDDEKNVEISPVEFNLEENQLRELIDVCNRYTISSDNTLSSKLPTVTGTKSIIYYDDIDTYRYSNNVEDKNFDTVYEYICNTLITEEAQKEFDTSLNNYFK